MKRLGFDALMIILMTMLLLVVNYYKVSQMFVAFGIVPLTVFYFLGSYATKKYGPPRKLS